MALMGTYPLTLEENADYDSGNGLTFALFSDAAQTLPFNLTGYTCSMMVRINPNDAAPVVTYTPTLGGALGTIVFLFSAAQNSTLYSLLSAPGGVGIYDILLTAGGGTKIHVIATSPIIVARSITR